MVNQQMKKIPVNKLYVLSDYPFRTYSSRERSVSSLVKNIDEHGLMSPIVVNSLDDFGYSVIDGYKRLRALKNLGWQEVPALVCDYDNPLAVSIDLHIGDRYRSALEKVKSYKLRYDFLLKNGISQDGAVAYIAKLSRDCKWKVQVYLKLSDLNDGLLELFANGEISLEDGLELSDLDNKLQEKIASFIEMSKEYSWNREHGKKVISGRFLWSIEGLFVGSSIF